MNRLEAQLPQLTETATAVVRTQALTKRLDRRLVLRGVQLEVAHGEFLAILGANGAGKTTLLKILATLMPRTSGKLELFGRDIVGSDIDARARIGLIGHQSMVYRDLSAIENLELFGKLYHLDHLADRCHDMLDRVGLALRANDPVGTFSRGMAQRIAIARALLHDPELILADEPFTGLDPASEQAIEQLFGELTGGGKTVVMVNHNIEQSLRLASRAIVLRGGVVVVDEPTYRIYPREVISEL
jgi:heme exporter protein A